MPFDFNVYPFQQEVDQNISFLKKTDKQANLFPLFSEGMPNLYSPIITSRGKKVSMR